MFLSIIIFPGERCAIINDMLSPLHILFSHASFSRAIVFWNDQYKSGNNISEFATKRNECRHLFIAFSISVMKDLFFSINESWWNLCFAFFLLMVINKMKLLNCTRRFWKTAYIFTFTRYHQVDKNKFKDLMQQRKTWSTSHVFCADLFYFVVAQEQRLMRKIFTSLNRLWN